MRAAVLSSGSNVKELISKSIKKIKTEIEVEYINDTSKFDELSWEYDFAIIDDETFSKYDHDVKSLIYSQLNENKIEVIVLLEELFRIDVYYSLNLGDYFLTPIDWQRFVLKIKSFESNNKIKEDLIRKNGDRRINKFVVKNKKEVLVIDYDRIRFYEKDGKKLLIHLEEEVITVNESFKELIMRLPRSFIRVHNSYIVNTKHISKVVELANRSYHILFEGSEDIALMSRYKSTELLNGFYKLR